MEKKAYENSITTQVYDLSALTPVQVEKCFDLEKLGKILPAEVAGNIRRVIITGCGDSYSAAGAMVRGFRELSGLRKCNTPDIMDFCHYYTEEKILKGFSQNEVLLIAISFSGGSQRVVDALEKAKQTGVHSLLITRNSASIAAQAAEYVLDVETPEGCNSPGLRSYFASLLALAALGGYLGVCNHNLSVDAFQQTKSQCTSYVLEFLERLPQIDEQMFAMAQRVKDLHTFEVIADGNEGYSAQFVEQKFIECGGVFCDHTTSEEFAHISFFLRGSSSIGTIILVNQADLSLSRMRDTVDGCLKQHRPTLVVTDVRPDFFDVRKGPIDTSVNIYTQVPMGVNAAEFAGKAEICSIPTAPAQWMSPLVDFIPGSLLAGYQAAINEHLFFAGRYDFRSQTWCVK